MSKHSKKLINSVASVVDECLEGLVAVNPALQILEGHRVIVRADITEFKAAGKVAVLSGGGSGHEPTHGGFVGHGMLSAAVAGDLFSSPPPDTILAAIRTVARNNDGGVLVVVKNYTGDRLNFGIACERANTEGLKVDMVVVGEDCALTTADKTAGRRGLAGVLFIHKIAGALSESGKSLGEILDITRRSTEVMATIGLSLTPCSLPGSGPSFHLDDDEMELGLGIHGEAGVKRMKVVSAKEAVDAMLNHMMDPQSLSCYQLCAEDSVALMVNNLGGTSILELNIVAKEAIHWLENAGMSVDRVYCGTFITSLEMAGISLTIMKLDDTRRKCLDAPTSAPGWAQPYLPSGIERRQTPAKMKTCHLSGGSRLCSMEAAAQLNATNARLLHKVICYVCEAVGNCEAQLNALDTGSGDGDCGTTLKKGLDAIWKEIGPEDSPTLPVSSPGNLSLSMATIVEQCMGGSSGALYSLFLSAAARPLAECCDMEGWMRALEAGIKAIQKYGGADQGDRTMLDALYPAYSSLVEVWTDKKKPVLDAFHAAVEAAEIGAKDTVCMEAHAGRASYVSRECLTQPDPGAHAVGIWMRAAYEAYKLKTTMS